MRPRSQWSRNYYVRFYYKKNSELRKVGGPGPHYAGFDTVDEARDHIADVLLSEDNNNQVHKISILPKEDL